jgi:hypothetical protein
VRAGWRLLEAKRSEKSRGERNEDFELRVPRLKKKKKKKNKKILAGITISPGIGRNA